MGKAAVRKKPKRGAKITAPETAPLCLTNEELIDKVKAYHPEVDAVVLGAAYDYAVEKHGADLRANGDPYYSHPVRVATLLADLHLDEQTIMAGLLHDTVEDTDAELSELSDKFGLSVADLVDGVTKLTQLEYRSVETKQAENFQKFILATTSDIRVLLVKLADRLHNMRTLTHLKPHKRQRIAGETMDIYAPLARRIGLYEYASEMEDLSFSEINPEARQAIIARLEELSSQNADDIDRIRDDLMALMELEGIECRIKGRRKQPFSIWRKLERKDISFRDVADIFAFRIIVGDASDCYRVLGAVHRIWACLPDRFRDFISVPKPNGYRSLHTTVRASGNRRVELQIRTENMNSTAERGVAAHWGYKNTNYGFDEDAAKAEGLDAEANLQAFAALLQHGAEPDEFLAHAKLEMYREHVFVFSPRGRLIILPQGAMPLDFAYTVHTAIGDTCIGAMINGEARSLRRELKNGDVVEIIRSNTPKPVAGWEALTITGGARSSIRRLVRAREIIEFRNLGESLIDQALRRAGLDPVAVELEDVATKAGFETLEALFEDIGRGRFSTARMMEAAFPGHANVPADLEGKTPIDSAHAPLLVAGKDLTPGVTLHLGRCCSPLPGDRILAIQEPERGLVVHRIDCPKLEEFDDQPERWVDLQWTELAETGAVAIGRISISAANKRGVLATLCQVVGKANGNITSVATGDRTPNFIDLIFDIEVEDLKRLTQILAALRSIAVVDRAERLQEA
ncbi:MAG: bifunctional (p)ppGpp synthetase/guanosine-3',5'-bis(diphosphate) 3'-pyrophosphohydrolase [Hyphomonadaceae bacterium]